MASYTRQIYKDSWLVYLGIRDLEKLLLDLMEGHTAGTRSLADEIAMTEDGLDYAQGVLAHFRGRLRFLK